MKDLVFAPGLYRPPPQLPPSTEHARVSIDLNDFRLELELFDRHRGLAQELVALLGNRAGLAGTGAAAGQSRRAAPDEHALTHGEQEWRLSHASPAKTMILSQHQEVINALQHHKDHKPLMKVAFENVKKKPKGGGARGADSHSSLQPKPKRRKSQKLPHSLK